MANTSKAYDMVKPFLASSVNSNKFEKILDVAFVGVNNVQQLVNSGQITDPAERKAAARQYVFDTLPLIGIEVTPEIQRVVDGAIESEVFALKQKLESKNDD
jgi:hypothetical protein